MANINFYLDKPNSETETLLFLRLFLNGKRYKISTGLRVKPKFWNKEKQEVRKSHINFFEMNSLLSDMKIKLEKIIFNAKINGIEITPTYLKNQFHNKQNNQDETKHFLEVYNDFIVSSQGIKKDTAIRSYKKTLRVLQEFSTQNLIKLTFSNINLNFYDKFVSYLINEKKLMNNSVGNYIKNLKTFMNYATERGYHNNTEYRKFKVFREDSQQISLDEMELYKLLQLDLSHHPRLENTRDLFLVQCFTGLRYSDMISIKAENIKGEFIILYTHKTREQLKIPIIPRLKPIIERLVNNDLRLITNQKMNTYLKEIGWRAGIDTATEIVYYKAGIRYEKTVPKYELICTHTGRRSFVTISLARGMRREILMRITGHKEQSSFSKYIKLTDSELLEEMLRIWGNF